jgi:hypothetical protein
MKQYCVGAPMECVALDLIGPLPLSHKGNKYILIVSDYFTKWAEGYPMPDMETTTIVDNYVTKTSHFFPGNTDAAVNRMERSDWSIEISKNKLGIFGCI